MIFCISFTYLNQYSCRWRINVLYGFYGWPRCNISNIMLEMDRMLRPGGRVYIRDSVTVMDELQALGTAIRWLCGLHDTSEGTHATWKILICRK